MQKTLDSKYDPQQVERKWYKHWEESGYFHQEPQKEKDPYCIVMPPPNVTGSLHLGHALDNTLQDILIRFKRMQGYNTLWVPGTDHAGIATQARVEEHLAKEGLTKYQLGREKFLERVWDWKHEYGNTITRQLRLLGASCDWKRERFTMDEGCSKAVLEVFVQLYEKSLIYKGNYIVNWCPKCKTTISDIEVEHKDSKGKLYHIRYPFKDGNGHVVVATTRPETMLGDTAIAVHPDDERYKEYIGKTAILPILNKEIPIVADTYVDPGFGSGAVKITPAHDPNDFEMAVRHKLPHVVVIGKDASMTGEAGPYQGMDRYDCRKQIIEDLANQGYLVNIEEHDHAVGQCYRCDTIIEPLVSPQWFVKMKPLAEPAMEAAKKGDVRFVPERFTKVYLGWLENIRDWCISRQLWWGHRIPVWYCDDCGKEICSLSEPKECDACAGKLTQDPDVLDTWFSSALWPFSTLGWPENTEDLSQFYPTSVLVTGRDIIFFWVARMLFMGIEFKEGVPFDDVFIHGLVLDGQGRKMSKSLGNGIDPIEVIDKYGADTLRFMLITGNTPGNDLRFQFERLDGARNFANKIWNASRFALMNLEDYDPEQISNSSNYSLADRWIVTRYQEVVNKVTESMEKYELGEAGKIIYEFIWNELCDWYIELIKPRLFGKVTEESKNTAQEVLYSTLTGALQLLHPFMPFITEEIWNHMPGKQGSIMLSAWPEVKDVKDSTDVAKMQLLMEIIRGIRNIRNEMNVPPGKKAEAIILIKSLEAKEALKDNLAYIETLASAFPITIKDTLEEKPEKAATVVAYGVEVYVPLEGLIDVEVEVKRLEKDIANITKELDRVTTKLNNKEFLKKAPKEVVNKETEKEKELTAKHESLVERLSVFQRE
ncbi:MAG: valine--tRNA ligase [Desulfitibacter sp. BRH_c19]|nr:MAG: valine--tRNA ligase [Desulfitibacter sp. BRH_c19]